MGARDAGRVAGEEVASGGARSAAAAATAPRCQCSWVDVRRSSRTGCVSGSSGQTAGADASAAGPS
eukprot:scaffold86292_cov75-Phaeocystis_antarctica.AAC.1